MPASPSRLASAAAAIETDLGLKSGWLGGWLLVRFAAALFVGLSYLVGTGSLVLTLAGVGVVMLGFAVSFAVRNYLQGPVIRLLGGCVTWGGVITLGWNLFPEARDWHSAWLHWAVCSLVLLWSQTLAIVKRWGREPRPRPPFRAYSIDMINLEVDRKKKASIARRSVRTRRV